MSEEPLKTGAEFKILWSTNPSMENIDCLSIQAVAWRAGGVSAAAGTPRPRTGTTQAPGAGHGGGGGYHGHAYHGQVENT